MSLFPIFLKLTGRPCIVIGAGHLAESKIESLLAAERAPSPSSRHRPPRASRTSPTAGELTLHLRDYAPRRPRRTVSRRRSHQRSRCQPRRLRRSGSRAASSSTPSTTRPSATSISLPSSAAATSRSPSPPPAKAPPSPSACARRSTPRSRSTPATGSPSSAISAARFSRLEPLNDSRNQLLHQLASRDVCGYDACPSRTLARAHALTNPCPRPTSPEEAVSTSAHPGVVYLAGAGPATPNS